MKRRSPSPCAWIFPGLVVLTQPVGCGGDSAAGGEGAGGATASGGASGSAVHATGGAGGASAASRGSGGAGSSVSSTAASTSSPGGGAGGATSGGSGASGGAAGSGGGSSGGPSGAGGASGTSGAGGATGSGGRGGSTGSGGASASTGSTSAGGSTGSGGASSSSSTGLGGSSASSGPAETKPIGYGQATTGGGSAKSTQVDSLAAMQAAIDAYSGTGGLVLQYTGKFDFSSITDPCVQHTLDAQTLEIKKKNDITILGANGSAANFGIHIAASSSNIIIRNMTIGLTPGGSDSDIVSLEGMSGGVPTNIWIDHNEFFTSIADCPGAGDTAFDGMVDIKKGADLVTVSYNYMHDHHKMSLNGYSDTDDAVRHVTFHHNLFENIGSRTPLQRYGYSHVFNNYFYKVLVSGINVRMKGYSLVEGNYFEDVMNPVTSRDSSEIGYWELRSNNLASAADVATGNTYGITWDDGSDGTVNATDWKTTAAYPEALGYSYSADSFSCVHAGLRSVVGAGKELATLQCK